MTFCSENRPHNNIVMHGPFAKIEDARTFGHTWQQEHGDNPWWNLMAFYSPLLAHPIQLLDPERLGGIDAISGFKDFVWHYMLPEIPLVSPTE